ncbi:MAG: hypothetical protein ABIG30_03050 [Candidatus Aenigmatarchaeota archaeon]
MTKTTAEPFPFVPELPSEPQDEDVEKYFQRNAIALKTVKDATPEQAIFSDIADPEDEKYFNDYFRLGMDELIESVDVPVNIQLFRIAMCEARKFQDVFDPCCQSGIFGCHIARGVRAYTGMDINPLGIEKAKARAKLNGLNPDIFLLGDVLEYNKKHEAIVGRYVANTPYFGADGEMIDALNSISRNVILIQSARGYHLISDTQVSLQKAFERHGFKFEVLTKPVESPAIGSYVFMMKATK